jgi:hypothetical protein
MTLVFLIITNDPVCTLESDYMSNMADVICQPLGSLRISVMSEMRIILVFWVSCVFCLSLPQEKHTTLVIGHHITQTYTNMKEEIRHHPAYKQQRVKTNRTS